MKFLSKLEDICINIMTIFTNIMIGLLLLMLIPILIILGIIKLIFKLLGLDIEVE